MVTKGGKPIQKTTESAAVRDAQQVPVLAEISGGKSLSM